MAQEVRRSTVIDEMTFVFRCGFPFSARSSLNDSVNIVEPEFRHPVEARRVGVPGVVNDKALDETAKTRNSCTDRSVHIMPIPGELLSGEIGSPGEAIHQFDHRVLGMGASDGATP